MSIFHDENSKSLSTCKETDREMEKYNISMTLMKVYHYRQFSYTKLSDAIAQAKKDQMVDKIPVL